MAISLSRTKEFELRTAIADELQAAIDTAEEQGASSEYIAGLEVAISLVTLSADARPHQLW